MTTVRDIETFLYAWAPRETAESWDNVGLLVGRGDREVRRVLAALDVTPAVAAEAAEGGVNDQLAKALGLTDTIPLNEQKIGRIGTLSCEIPLEQFLHDVVKSLGCRGLRYRSGGRPVRRGPWAAEPAANISPRHWPRGAIALSPATCGITTFWTPRASTSSTRGISPRRTRSARKSSPIWRRNFPSL